MGKNRIDLSGRTAVITGGAQGIGRAVAERFAASGARCIIWDQDGALAEKAAAEIGAGTVALPLDVTDPLAVDAAAERASRETGTVDILVTSAGIAGANATLWDYPVEEWRRVQAINVDGTYHCARSVVPLMRRSGYGRIVFVASVAGKEGNPNAAAYSASKAAVIAMTKSLGKELAREDIAVNCITPAAARTRIFDQMTDEHINYMLSKIPRGRFLEPVEVASMVAWLVSEENSFTTGATFDLSGGRATY
jgi:3-oxoacyl-[acyl-carrier protein] reductase